MLINESVIYRLRAGNKTNTAKRCYRWTSRNPETETASEIDPP
jgi:hypothetical protein